MFVSGTPPSRMRAPGRRGLRAAPASFRRRSESSRRFVLEREPGFELLLQPLVELEHPRNVAPGLAGERRDSGPQVAGVQRPAVVLGQDQLRVLVGREQHVEVEGRRLGVLLGVEEDRVVVGPAEGVRQQPPRRRPDLVEAPRVGVAPRLRIVPALDETDGEEEEGVDRGVLLARGQGELRVAVRLGQAHPRVRAQDVVAHAEKQLSPPGLEREPRLELLHLPLGPRQGGARSPGSSGRGRARPSGPGGRRRRGGHRGGGRPGTASRFRGG